MKYYIGDIETNAININDIDRIHVLSLSYKTESGKWNVVSTTDYEKMRKIILDPNVCIVGHNFVQYDIPALEKILKVKAKCKVIDTLAISWVLFPSRIIGTHGLADWGEDFGIPKVKVDDNEWEGIGQWKLNIIDNYESGVGRFSGDPYLTQLEDDGAHDLYNRVKKEQEDFEALMRHRCEEDVKINTKLWLLTLNKLQQLYDNMEDAYKWMDYVTFKMNCLQEQAEVGLTIDLKRVQETLTTFNNLKEEKVSILKELMPDNPIYSVKKMPKVMYRKDESLSSNGEKWLVFLEEQGLPPNHTEEVRYISGYEDPKPTSVDQVKDWFYSLGWKPETFKENEKFRPKVMNKKDGSPSAQAEAWYKLLEEKNLPKNYNGGVKYKTEQIKNAKGNLCKSVLKLAEEVPEINEYVDLGVYTHRIGLLKSFLTNSDPETGFAVSGASMFTNTLRLQHKKPFANLNKVTKDHLPEEGKICWKDGVHIRQNIVAHPGHILVGSDLDSLENRLAFNFMNPYDPEYVATKNQKDHDSHLFFAVFAGALTQEQADAHLAKEEDHSATRGIYKTANYALQYGAGASTLAKNAGISLKEAKKVKDAYWEMNHSITKAADSLEVKITKVGNDKEMWVRNSLNGYFYSLRTEKDKFSTLCQGSASYILDLFIMLMRKKGWKISLQYHDEILFNIVDSSETRKKVADDIDSCINTINNKLGFDIKMGAAPEFGDSYAAVH